MIFISRRCSTWHCRVTRVFLSDSRTYSLKLEDYPRLPLFTTDRTAPEKCLSASNPKPERQQPVADDEDEPVHGDDLAAEPEYGDGGGAGDGGVFLLD